MKRDCGNGELIPVKWEVVWCVGQSDSEKERGFSTRESALEVFEELCCVIRNDRCSNVRLYAKDKAGYANCMKSFTVCVDGSVNETDRMSEL